MKSKTLTVLALDPGGYDVEDRGYKTPCYIWKGRTQGAGKYPVMWLPEKSTWQNGDYPVHKLAWELIHGEMPEKLVPDHLCRVHRCVNGEHIEAVTVSINKLRGKKPERKLLSPTCSKGHAYDKENTYVNPKGERKCKICRRAKAREKWNQ